MGSYGRFEQGAAGGLSSSCNIRASFSITTAQPLPDKILSRIN
jgi:hypothetical protein